jgi:hypothetical protein
MNRILLGVIAALIACGPLLAGCSSPEPALYTIAVADGAPRSGAPSVIVLQTVTLARYLDRSQIVRSSEDTRLQVQVNDWWGEPLSPMLGRILADELSQRLPQSSVIMESGAVSASPGAVVELDVRRLDADVRGMLVLQAQANVNFKDKRPSVLRNFNITVPLAGATTADQVKATGAAVGQLADGIATMLTTAR